MIGQLAMMVLTPAVREAADWMIGNLEDGLSVHPAVEEIAGAGRIGVGGPRSRVEGGAECDPSGVGARSLQEVLLLQLESRSARGGVAWQHRRESFQAGRVAQREPSGEAAGPSQEHIQIALEVIRKLDPKPGLRYGGSGAREVAPDVYIYNDSGRWVVQLSEEDLPQLRLNGGYRRMLEPDNGSDKVTRNYVRERFNSALQLIRNIEQRRQTILRVCQAIARRQTEFLERGPMRCVP